MTKKSSLPAKVTNLENFQPSTNSESFAVFPNHLTPTEYRELNQESGIHSDLIKLNFFHLEGHNALDRLFISEKLKRTNTGTVSYSILKKYRHIEVGGWWVSGLDVINQFSEDLYGQFKPLKPRLSEDKGKVIKYEGPPKYPTGIIALRISSQIWRSLAIRHNIQLGDRPLAISFWEWVKNNPQIPLVITEGAKKAACLLSEGYAAIALPGVFNGYRQPKDELGRRTGLPKLIPQLQVFAQPGRQVYFAFDKDNKASTIATVNMAIAKTGNLFAKAKAEVKVIRWQESAKGVDDLIVQKGAEAFHNAYDEALSLATWSVRSSVQLTYKANIQVNRRYLGSLEPKAQVSHKSNEEGSEIIDIPNKAKLVCLKSPKGSGKTHLLEQIVDNAIREGKWVLLLTHRIQLGEALCQRLGLPYLTEVRTVEYGTVLGYGLCVDSLHPNSGARFNAENWQDGVVIIDEAEQVMALPSFW